MNAESERKWEEAEGHLPHSEMQMSLLSTIACDYYIIQRLVPKSSVVNQRLMWLHYILNRTLVKQGNHTIGLRVHNVHEMPVPEGPRATVRAISVKTLMSFLTSLILGPVPIKVKDIRKNYLPACQVIHDANQTLATINHLAHEPEEFGISGNFEVKKSSTGWAAHFPMSFSLVCCELD